MPDGPGRPRASSRETIAEAACELFLEQGYDVTTVEDIARRAGVARSSFFGYFASKGEVVWAGFDERLRRAEQAIAGGADVEASLIAIGDRYAPDPLALALAQSEAMGLAEELEREQAVRRHRLGRSLAARLRGIAPSATAAEIRAAGLAAAVFSALEHWAADPAPHPLDAAIADALRLADPPPAGPVRQLRLVVQADDEDAAVAFYRDVVGLPVEEAYEAEGGARVVILGAGRATLELSNAAQVALIDRVETDGDAPADRLRVALEVDDASSATERLAAGGATVQASVRETPWRSLNSRLRAPAGLQLTLFQELGAE